MTAVEPSHRKIRILLADDHPVTRAGIRKILETAEDLEVIGEVGSGFEVQEWVGRLLPDVLLLDLQMPGPRPSELERWVRQQYPQVVTLILTAHSRDSYLATMIDAGAAGFLSKQDSAQALIASIRRAVGGELLFSEEQYNRAALWRREAGAKWAGLSERQQRLIRLLAKGKQNDQIAEELGVTTKTVSYHIAAIMRRLDVGSRTEILAWVLQHAPENLE